METVNNKTIESKVTRDFEIYNGVLTEDYQENINEFVRSFASKFQINWGLDTTLKVKSRHNKDGANLLINFQSKHAENVDPNQLTINFKEPAPRAGKKEKAGELTLAQ